MNSRMTAKIQTILQGICVNSEVSATVNQQYEILNQQNKSEKKKKKTFKIWEPISLHQHLHHMDFPISSSKRSYSQQ